LPNFRYVVDDYAHRGSEPTLKRFHYHERRLIPVHVRHRQGGNNRLYFSAACGEMEDSRAEQKRHSDCRDDQGDIRREDSQAGTTKFISRATPKKKGIYQLIIEIVPHETMRACLLDRRSSNRGRPTFL